MVILVASVGRSGDVMERRLHALLLLLLMPLSVTADATSANINHFRKDKGQTSQCR